jgi:hypothetical protein
MEGLALPSDARMGPNCGVTAVAIVAGVSFATAWAEINKACPRKGNWKGRTRAAERDAALAALGVRFEDVPLARCVTLQTWALRYAKPGERYLVQTTGHIQVLKDRAVADQGGILPVMLHRGRRKHVCRVQRIL